MSDTQREEWYQELVRFREIKAAELFSKKVYKFMEISNLIRKLRYHTSHVPTYYVIDDAERNIETLKNVPIASLNIILYEYHHLIQILFG